MFDGGGVVSETFVAPILGVEGKEGIFRFFFLLMFVVLLLPSTSISTLLLVLGEEEEVGGGRRRSVGDEIVAAECVVAAKYGEYIEGEDNDDEAATGARRAKGEHVF